jgi:hypothetical protein
MAAMFLFSGGISDPLAQIFNFGILTRFSLSAFPDQALAGHTDLCL